MDCLACFELKAIFEVFLIIFGNHTFQISDMPTHLKLLGAHQNWSTFVYGLFRVHDKIFVRILAAVLAP